MPKSEYNINGRQFHIERVDNEWTGWFLDSPQRRFTGRLKMDVLCEVGYSIPGTEGIHIGTGNLKRRYASRLMRDAYADFRAKLATGHRPRFRDDRPLSKFIIYARDECRCLYCGTLVECLTLDHVCPVSLGGDDSAANIATCCPTCNSRKRDSRLPDESEKLAELRRRNSTYGIRNDQIVSDAVRPRLEIYSDDPYSDLP